MYDFWTTAYDSFFASLNIIPVAVALPASIALLFILRKVGLMRRPTRVHTLIAYVYYLYIPAVFIGSAVLWSAVSTMERSIVTTLETSRPSIIRSSVLYTVQAWRVMSAKLPDGAYLSSSDTARAIANAYTEQFLPRTEKLRGNVFFAPLFSRAMGGFSATLVTSVNDLLQNVARGGSGEESTRSLWVMGLTNAMRGGLVYNLLKAQIVRQFPPLYKQIGILFAFLMVPALLEFALSFFLMRRAKRMEPGDVPEDSDTDVLPMAAAEAEASTPTPAPAPAPAPAPPPAQEKPEDATPE